MAYFEGDKKGRKGNGMKASQPYPGTNGAPRKQLPQTQELPGGFNTSGTQPSSMAWGESSSGAGLGRRDSGLVDVMRNQVAKGANSCPPHAQNQHQDRQSDSATSAQLTAIMSQLGQMVSQQARLVETVQGLESRTAASLERLDGRLGKVEAAVARLSDPSQVSAPKKEKPQEPGLFDEALAATGKGNHDRAYSLILEAGDDMQLARLMKRSGVVFKGLNMGLAQKVAKRLGLFMKRRVFLDDVLDWMPQVFNF